MLGTSDVSLILLYLWEIWHFFDGLSDLLFKQNVAIFTIVCLGTAFKNISHLAIVSLSFWRMLFKSLLWAILDYFPLNIASLLFSLLDFLWCVCVCVCTRRRVRTHVHTRAHACVSLLYLKWILKFMNLFSMSLNFSFRLHSRKIPSSIPIH